MLPTPAWVITASAAAKFSSISANDMNGSALATPRGSRPGPNWTMTSARFGIASTASSMRVKGSW